MRAPGSRRPALLVFAMFLGACGDAAFSPGARTLVQVERGQYFSGAPPAEAGGPAIAVFGATNSVVKLGTQGRAFGGDVAQGAQSIAISFSHDPGYWVVPAGLPDPQLPGNLEFSARLSFSAATPPGPATVEARAIDAQGHVGPAAVFGVSLVDLDPVPAGKLVFSLSWDSNADLDLHVVDPTGTEVWARNISTNKGGGFDPNAAAKSGILDFDSNSMCILDGRRRENVIWKQQPPSGRYTVRVDTWSLCGEPEAYWHVVARLDGKVVGEASGPSRDSDASLPHGAGAGALALQLNIP
jgi:hypothetical protein